jgi:bacteriocin biosynthesis cyclodehydratase domain-containing protein
MDRICLKPGVHWINAEGDVGLFLHFGNRFLIRGPFVRSFLKDLLSYLKEPRTSAEIRSIFSSESALEKALDALSAAGFLETLRDTDPEYFPEAGDLPYLRFLERFLSSSESSKGALARIRKTKLKLLGCGRAMPELLEACQALRFQRIDILDSVPDQLHHSDDELLLLSGNWLDLPRIRSWNRLLHSSRRRWLCVLEDFYGGSIGPYFGAEDGPCFECLLRRRAEHLPDLRRYEEAVAYLERHPPGNEIRFPLFSKLLAENAALEILKLLARPIEPRIGLGLYEFDFLNHRTEFHPILPSPSCEVCGPVFEMPIFETEPRREP